jgi:hypothetical protein
MDDEAPKGARACARHTLAPAGEGWDPIERCDWAAIAAVLPTPWPLGAQRQDLRYWSSLARIRKVVRPGYRELAARWGVSDKQARTVCADVEWWADPRFGDPDPTRAQQGRSKGAARAQQGLTLGAPDPVLVDVLDAKGLTLGAARAQQGLTEGAARAPNKDREQKTETETETEESMSAAPTKRRKKAQATAEPTAPTAEPTAPTAAQRERSEAEHCFARLEELRLSRHAGGRGLSAAVWVPKVRTVLAKVPAQDLYDAMVWLLHDPAAAWHRGEDSRNPSADRTVDLACILRHPEYALRRTWTGAQAPTPAELAEQRPDQPAPAWVQRQAQSPSGRRAAAAAARIARENAEAEAWLAAQQPDLDDSDVPF